MSWSKVQRGKKPLKWWWYKVLCEASYSIMGSSGWYYHYLNKLCALGFNLYGESYEEPFNPLNRKIK